MARWMVYVGRLLLPAQPWVERVAERVAQHVEGVDDERDRGAGEDHQPWRVLDVALRGAGEHLSPRRRRRLGAEAEKAQRRLGDDRLTDHYRQQHQRRRED